jgi:hypothetical protein
MKVKIINGKNWYKDKVDYIYDVFDNGRKFYFQKEKGCIEKSDCEVVHDGELYEVDMSTFPTGETIGKVKDKIKRRDLKCCGNCIFYLTENQCLENGKHYCLDWQYDGLTRKERDI